VKRVLLARPGEALLSTELKITVGDIAEPDVNVPDFIVDRLIQSKGVSFQDMQSISRSFERFTGFLPPKSNHVHNIILGQAARHAIVHAGSRVDERFLGQVVNASPRDVMPIPTLGEEIQLEREDVERIAVSMEHYLGTVLVGIKTAAV
jgi:hypothetical protein